MSNQVIIAFIAVVALLFYFFGGGVSDLPEPNTQVQTQTAPAQAPQKQAQKQEVKIEYKGENSPRPPKVQAPPQVPSIDTSMPQTSQIQIQPDKEEVAATTTATHKLVLTRQKQSSPSSAPPQVPTVIKGEINGERFQVIVRNDAPNENLSLTIQNSAGGTANLDLSNVAQILKPGSVADMGNIMMPQTQDISSQDESYIEQTVQANVEASANEAPASLSAPPSPPMPPVN